jgi:hypothetical protein
MLPERVHDHEQRDEDGAEQRRVEPARSRPQDRDAGGRRDQPLVRRLVGGARPELDGLGGAVEVAAAGGEQVELGREAAQVLPLLGGVVDVVDLEPAEPGRRHVDDDLVVDRAAADRGAGWAKTLTPPAPATMRTASSTSISTLSTQ